MRHGVVERKGEREREAECKIRKKRANAKKCSSQVTLWPNVTGRTKGEETGCGKERRQVLGILT